MKKSWNEDVVDLMCVWTIILDQSTQKVVHSLQFSVSARPSEPGRGHQPPPFMMQEQGGLTLQSNVLRLPLFSLN
jgi:hypothetical protein